MGLVLGIDARAAAEVPAGRGRYVRELLRALVALPEAADTRLELWARTPWSDPALDGDPRIAWRLVGLPDPLWHLAVAARAGGDAFLSTNSYLTAWATRVPTAVVVYDLVPFVPGAQAQSRAARIERATIRPALRRAAALACISTATRDDLVARFPAAARKASVIPLAADASLLAAAPPALDPAHGLDGRPYVLAVGTLEPRKNLARLIAAWSALPEDLRAAHALALVGPRGWDDEDVLAAARAADVRLLGRVSEDQLHALYANATAFAYPSLYEGFGLPVLEAMAAGAPVLTSNVSSLPEVAGDAALLVDPRDPRALEAALERLLRDADLRGRLREAGRRRAAAFTWERTARETHALLAQAARTRS